MRHALAVFILALSLMPLAVQAGDINIEMANVAKSGDIIAVRALIKKGADVNARVDIKRCKGCTALVIAAREGHSEVIKVLIEEGASVDAKAYGFTALMFASINGYPESVKLLLKNDADANGKDSDGRTALFCALELGKGDSQTLQALIEGGGKGR